jgi:hypothetical protein
MLGWVVGNVSLAVTHGADDLQPDRGGQQAEQLGGRFVDHIGFSVVSHHVPLAAVN